MDTLEPILQEHPFLMGLNPGHIKLIVGCASNMRFDAGQKIFQEGEEANAFYVVRSGKVALEIYAPDRGSLIVETLGAGDILGWSWLIPPYQWHLDARVVELTRLIALDGKCLRKKCEEDHELGYELLKRFASIMEQRLEATRMQLLDLYGERD